MTKNNLCFWVCVAIVTSRKTNFCLWPRFDSILGACRLFGRTKVRRKKILECCPVPSYLFVAQKSIVGSWPSICNVRVALSTFRYHLRLCLELIVARGGRGKSWTKPLFTLICILTLWECRLEQTICQVIPARIPYAEKWAPTIKKGPHCLGPLLCWVGRCEKGSHGLNNPVPKQKKRLGATVLKVPTLLASLPHS